jgi:hypothetical protein
MIDFRILKYLFYNLNVSVYTYSIKTMYSVKCSDFDVESRLYELRDLKDGWYDGKQGSQLSKDGIAWLAKSWRCFSRNDISAPCFFPTVEGNIQIEWSFDCVEVVLKIDLQKRSGHCFVMDLTTGHEVENDVEISFDFDNQQEWTKLFDEILRLQNKY